MHTVFGIYFMNDKELTDPVITDVPIAGFNFSEQTFIKLIKDHLPKAKIRPVYGVIKEIFLTSPGKVGMEKPAKMGGEKFQAFILERSRDSIIADQSAGNKDFFVNEKKLDLSFIRYDVTIIKID